MRAILTATAFALLAAAPASAQPRSSELRCTVAGGFGFFGAGQRAANCVYYRADGVVEFYVGSSSRVGADIGPTNAQRLAFRVRTANSGAPAALQGDFVGGAVGVTIGEGVSTEALVGGAGGGATLLPLDNPNYTGLNVTAALGVLHLQYAGSEPRALHERY